MVTWCPDASCVLKFENTPRHSALNAVSQKRHLHAVKPKRWSADFQLPKTTLAIGLILLKRLLWWIFARWITIHLQIVLRTHYFFKSLAPTHFYTLAFLLFPAWDDFPLTDPLPLSPTNPLRVDSSPFSFYMFFPLFWSAIVQSTHPLLSIISWLQSFWEWRPIS